MSCVFGNALILKGTIGIDPVGLDQHFKHHGEWSYSGPSAQNNPVIDGAIAQFLETSPFKEFLVASWALSQVVAGGSTTCHIDPWLAHIACVRLIVPLTPNMHSRFTWWSPDRSQVLDQKEATFGDYVVFDNGLPHKATNLSDEPNINLLINLIEPEMLAEFPKKNPLWRMRFVYPGN